MFIYNIFINSFLPVINQTHSSHDGESAVDHIGCFGEEPPAERDDLSRAQYQGATLVRAQPINVVQYSDTVINFLLL